MMSRLKNSEVRKIALPPICRDQLFALALAPAVVTLLALIIPIMLLLQGRPVFFVVDRMKTPTASFRLIKLRTMKTGEREAVLGGHATHRVTRLGRVLRACRLDELPQIWNILVGDMRFIGPRPPLRRYVEAYPDTYAKVLSRRPGVTGLATVLFHSREALLLGACDTAAETDRVYRSRCIPRKARLDRFYHKKRNVGLDLLILYWTFSKLVSRRQSVRPSRVRSRRISFRAWPA